VREERAEHRRWAKFFLSARMGSPVLEGWWSKSGALVGGGSGEGEGGRGGGGADRRMGVVED